MQPALFVISRPGKLRMCARALVDVAIAAASVSLAQRLSQKTAVKGQCQADSECKLREKSRFLSGKICWKETKWLTVAKKCWAFSVHLKKRKRKEMFSQRKSKGRNKDHETEAHGISSNRRPLHEEHFVWNAVPQNPIKRKALEHSKPINYGSSAESC